MQTPPPYYPPQRPAGNGIMKPLLIGCAGIFVLAVLIGGVAAWFAMRAVGTAINHASEASQVAQGAVTSAEQAVTQAGSSPDPEHAAAAGAAILKSFVDGGKSHVATLSREDLKTYLPASAGSLARTTSESSSGTFSGISGTSASANYGTGDGSVSIAVTDAANMAALTTIMDVAMGVESEDDSGYQKTVQLGDVTVHEKWENSGKHGELIGLVGKRFVVDVTGNGVDPSVDEAAFKAVDLAKLANATAAAPK